MPKSCRAWVNHAGFLGTFGGTVAVTFDQTGLSGKATGNFCVTKGNRYSISASSSVTFSPKAQACFNVSVVKRKICVDF